MKIIIMLVVGLWISIGSSIWLSVDRDFWRECAERQAKISVLQTKELTAWSEYAGGKIDSDSLMVIHKITDSYLDSFRTWLADK